MTVTLHKRAAAVSTILFILSLTVIVGSRREAVKAEPEKNLDKDSILAMVDRLWCYVYIQGAYYPYRPGRCEEARKLVIALLDSKRSPDPRSKVLASNRICFYAQGSKTADICILYRREWKVGALQLGDAKPIFFEITPELRTGFETLLAKQGADIQGFTDNLEVKDERIQVNSILALERNGDKAKEALPKLRKLITEQNLKVRHAAACAAFVIGRDSQVLKVLFQDFATPPEERQTQAGHAIQRIVPLLGKEHVLPLQARLQDADKWVRSQAATLLGEMGSKAKEAVPALLNALKDREWGVRADAALALGRTHFASEAVLGALIAATSDIEPRVQDFAIVALGNLGPKAKAALPALKKALQDADWDRKQVDAAYAILKIDPSNKEAKDVLKHLGLSLPPEK
jgi:HEAT repeat protein